MLRITGLLLKKEGLVLVSDGKKAVVQWVERSSRKRTYHYLVHLQGEKYTKPTRLQPYEVDYWKDTISKNRYFYGGPQKND